MMNKGAAIVVQSENEEAQWLLLPRSLFLGAARYSVERVGANLLLTPIAIEDWKTFSERPVEVSDGFLIDRGDEAAQNRPAVR